MTTANAEAIAAELGISYDLFLRTRKDLEKRGFPAPLPLVSRRNRDGKALRGHPPLRWSLDAVRDWIRNPTPARAAPQPAARTRDHATLEARLG